MADRTTFPWGMLAHVRELEAEVRAAVKVKGLKIKIEPDNTGQLPNPNHARLADMVVSRIEGALARRDRAALALFRARAALWMSRRPA